jgi:adenylate cyclase class IV
VSIKKESRFVEIERKYLVAGDRLDHWCTAVLALGPRSSSVSVSRDLYWVSQDKMSVLRLRVADKSHELTLKSRSADIECRSEINISLDSLSGNQEENISEFAKSLRFTYCGDVSKKSQKFAFSDCEIACYSARFQDKEVSCIEIEALITDDILEARELFRRYETKLGIDDAAKSNKSLAEIFFGGNLDGNPAAKE